MSQTPEAPLLSPEIIAEMAKWVELPVVAIEGNPYYANFCIRDLLTDRATFRQMVAAELVALRDLTVELCIHGGHVQPEEIDEIAARLGIELPR